MLMQVSNHNRGIFLLRVFAVVVLAVLLTGEGWVLYSRVKQANTLSSASQKLYTPTIDNQGFEEALKRSKK